MRRHWSPCRKCGAEHKNPMSSSVCQPCGAEERKEREQREQLERQLYESSPFGQFMRLPEDERWRMVFDFLEERQ